MRSGAKRAGTRYAYCPIHNFFRPGWCKGHDTDRIHALYTRAYLRFSRTGQALTPARIRRRRVKVILLSLIWPIRCIFAAARSTIAFGPKVPQMGAPGLWRQFSEQLCIGFTEGIPPRSYYIYSLFLPENRSRAHKYIHYHQNEYLSAPFVTQSDRARIDDKFKFYLFCVENRIPTVPILAIFRSGKEEIFSSLPDSDLIEKPVSGYGGYDIDLWRWHSSGTYLAADKELDELSLKQHLRRRSTQHEIVLQPRLRNHDMLGHFSLGALCTARLVTARCRNGRSRVIMAILRMPVGNTIVDNFSEGGIASPIDIDNGTLTRNAVSWRPMSEEYERHPDTEHRIVGAMLPHWEKAVALCTNAHVAFESCPAIGWDIAFTETGPVFLEANLPFGIELAQMVSGNPLLSTYFQDALLDHASEHADLISP